jgi:hypothetical protein
VVIEEGVAVTRMPVTVGPEGVDVTDTAMGTIAVPDFVVSCVEIALTVSQPEAGAVFGAVYKPELEIVPVTADQLTAEL